MWPNKKDIPLFVGVPVIMTHRVHVPVDGTGTVCFSTSYRCFAVFPLDMTFSSLRVPVHTAHYWL